MTVYSSEEIHKLLATLDGWEYTGNAIMKEFTFAAFMDGIHFINTVAEAAEAHDHHPDIDIRYRKVCMALTTHSENDITEKDFNMAKIISTLAQT